MFNWFKSKKKDTAGDIDNKISLGELLSMHTGVRTIDGPGGPTACWMFRTEGLRRHGQKELLFALKKDAGGGSEDPLHFARMVEHFAVQGRIVDVCGLSEFGPTHPGLYGRKDYRGAAYAKPFNLEPLLPEGAKLDDYLAVIPLLAPEVESTQRTGLAQTLSRMGRQARFFPYPTWTDITRPTAIDRAFMGSSMAMQVAGYFQDHGVMAWREEGFVHLELPAAAAASLAKGIKAAQEANVPLLMPTTAGWERCAAHLTWEPGSREPTAIAASTGEDRMAQMSGLGQRLLGCFTMFVVAPGQDAGVRIIEDGFGLILTPEKAAWVCAALAAGKSAGVEASGELLPFEWHIVS